MRKTLVAAGVMLAATLGSVSAEDMQAVIQAVDVETRQMTLDDGTVIVVAEYIPIEALQPGQEVLVSFEEGASGEKVATQIQQPN